LPSGLQERCWLVAPESGSFSPKSK
jgi:hypothetical protein